MLRFKNDNIKRFVCFLLSILLVFCIVISPICEFRVQAMSGVVTMVGVGAVLLIGTILVGLGIEIVEPGAFDRLCKQVHEKLQSVAGVRDEVFLKIKDGVQYVENQLVVQIIKILYELNAFTKVPVTKILNRYGVNFKVFEMSNAEIIKTPVSYFGTAFNYDITAYAALPGVSKYESFKFNDSFSISILSDIHSPPTFYISGFKIFSYGSFYYGQSGGAICGDIGFPIIMNGYLSFPITFKTFSTGQIETSVITAPGSHEIDTSTGSICPDYKVGEKIPSVSAEGNVSMPFDTPWSANPSISVSGVPSIPITVPSDLGSLKDMPQNDVMTGNPSDILNPPADIAIDKEIDKALQDMKTPPQLIEKFPFSIPFDVFRAIQSLSAAPVAPAFIIPLKFPEYGIDWEFKMDWTNFAIPIAILKWGTFLVFLLYLAVGTKKLIWG